MRTIDKPQQIPDELINTEAQNNFTEILAQKIVSDNHSKIYRKVASNLFNLYAGKCCYCESKLSGSEIDHYRPKSVYYWLVYSWDNLLLVCPACNKTKGTKFPIDGNNHATIGNVSNLQDVNNLLTVYNEMEKPTLIHPEIEKINQDIFSFETNGKMATNDNGGRFSKTIETIKLNRQELLFHRKTLFDELFAKHTSIKIDAKLNQEERERKKKELLGELIKKSTNQSEDYTALRKFLVRYYASIINS